MKKLLVVGCGSIGRRHAKNAATLAETAVCDIDRTIGKSVATEIRSVFFPDLEKALAWGPDYVIVSTPTQLHIPVALKSIRAGAHVMIEKPLSHSMDRVDDFLNEADRRGRMVFSVCNMRFHPAVAAIAGAISRVGKPIFSRVHYGNYLPDMRPGVDYRKLYCANRSMGGGVVLDAIHEVDYLTWLFGPVVAVICESGQLSDLDLDVEDYAGLILRHSNGVRSEIHLDYLQRVKRRGCEIVGEKGTLIWLSEGKFPEDCCVKLFDADAGTWETLMKAPTLDASIMYRTLVEKFLQAAEGVNVSLPDGREAMQLLSVMLAAKRSSKTGRLVKIPEN